MKRCFKCGVSKHLAEFYKHNRMADGHVNKCKDCNKIDVKANRDAKIDYYRGYDAWRYINDDRVKCRHVQYAKTDRGADRLKVGRAAWISRNPDARAAHVIVGNAVRDGRLHKPSNCSSCGSFTPSRSMHAHHHDYSAPLDVTWLCVSCHVNIHKGD